MQYSNADRTYNEEIANKIIARIASGEYVRDACKAEGMEASTIYSWKKYRPDFTARFEVALEEKADILIKKGFEILSHPLDDDVVDAGKSMRMCNNARVNRARYLAEKYFWWAAKCDKNLSDKDIELAQLIKHVSFLESEIKKNGK